jgi:hypothetical protein
MQLGTKLTDDQVTSITTFLRALNGKGIKGKDSVAGVEPAANSPTPAMP